MSKKGLSQRKMDDDVIRAVLMPVYYRHEFARRNDDVVKESQEVLKQFPMSSNISGGSGEFLNEIGSDTFSDALSCEYTQETSKTKKRIMREYLGKFMREREVLPVPPLPLSFFPKEMGYKEPTKDAVTGKIKSQPRNVESAKRLFVIWRSLIGFERLLLAEGMTDKPCFMPVVPLNLFHGTKGVYDVKSERMGQMSKHRMMVAIDNTRPLEIIGTNLELLANQLDVLARLRQEGDADARKTERMPWSSFDLYLRFADFRKNPVKVKNYKELALEFHKTENITVDTAVELANAVNNYKNWESEAPYWVKNYRQII